MNKTLLLGLIITIFMLCASLFGKYVAPHDLNESAQVSSSGGELIVPPFPPSKNYPLGTDKYGYDILAKLLAGSKYTIFVAFSVAFARMAIGSTIGLLLGYFGKAKASRGGQVPIWNMLNGIPVFVIVWMIMIGISINPAPSAPTMTLILAVVLTILGIPSVAGTMKDKTAIIREKQFVLSARSIGAGSWSIMWKHVLQHLKESFLILFVQEIVLILGLFGQLAILNIFVGGTRQFRDPIEYVSRTNEWSGLIGQSRDYLFAYQWVLFMPLAAYIVFILGFHLISLGLEKHYRTTYAKVSQI
ncbi:ABC transporter permease [Paenibacillus rhizovicinus]|uniref:ABC transporter permease n=1 Tax=Paenibacillus rhizovicinus TaxID=2704463 RepID=A0A6C0P2J8_9BACL|nr:ABC transporter permease subunit [Paenibacillus rhizovicinus]QHW32718.1 ABC transporter permease [Paenibacillus rhizovicinus]